MLLFLSHIHTYTGVHFPFNIQALYKTGKNSFLTTGYRAAVECCILGYKLCSQEAETKHEYGKEKKKTKTTHHKQASSLSPSQMWCEAELYRYENKQPWKRPRGTDIRAVPGGSVECSLCFVPTEILFARKHVS